MVVHYPSTVWKNSYAEHEVTGKTYNLKKKEKSRLPREQLVSRDVTLRYLNPAGGSPKFDFRGQDARAPNMDVDVGF